MSTSPDSSAKFDKFRRQLILKSRPVGKEERVEWFQQFEQLVEKAFPGQEVRINRPGVAHRMFAAEVAIPRMRPEQLIDFAREFEQLFLEAMPVTAEKLFTNAYQDRMDVMWEAAVDLGDSYVTMAVKLRNAEFGAYEFNQDDRGRGRHGDRYGDRPGGDRGDRPERRPYENRERNFDRDREDRPRPRRFDSEGNERPYEDRPRRFPKRPFGDRRPGGSGGLDRDRRPGGGGGGFDRNRRPWENRDRDRGDFRGRDQRRNDGGSDRPWENRDRDQGRDQSRDYNRDQHRDRDRDQNRGREGSGEYGSRKPFRPGGGGGGKNFGKGGGPGRGPGRGPNQGPNRGPGGPSRFNKGKRNGPRKDRPND